MLGGKYNRANPGVTLIRSLTFEPSKTEKDNPVLSDISEVARALVCYLGKDRLREFRKVFPIDRTCGRFRSLTSRRRPSCIAFPSTISDVLWNTQRRIRNLELYDDQASSTHLTENAVDSIKQLTDVRTLRISGCSDVVVRRGSAVLESRPVVSLCVDLRRVEAVDANIAQLEAHGFGCSLIEVLLENIIRMVSIAGTYSITDSTLTLNSRRSLPLSN